MPRRDAQRNYERLLAAAETAFDTYGVDASLDDIAKAAGVGNATLYRHFPSREALVEGVYRDRVRTLCESAGSLAAAGEPGTALVTWLRTVITHLNGNRGLREAFDSAYSSNQDRLRGAAEPLLVAAQAAGAIRPDLSTAELITLTTAVAKAATLADAERCLGLLIDGLGTK